MAFTVRDLHDLTRLLVHHPEWQAELRRLLLTEDLLALPAVVRELAAAQQRTEQRVQELVAAQQRTEQRVQELVAAQQHTEVRLDRLESAVALLVETQARMEERLGRMEPDVASIKGTVLEQKYAARAPSFFGSHLRRVQLVWPGTLPPEVEDTLEASLTREELQDVLRLDLVVRGRPRERPHQSEVWLAVEVSSVVDRQDVERAQRRAALLRRAGFRAVPVAAGESFTAGAEEAAEGTGAVLLLDGRGRFWDQALATA